MSRLDDPAVKMNGVRSYGDEPDVDLVEDGNTSRLVVRAYTESGYNWTDVDLLDLIAWLRANRPDLLATSAKLAPDA